MYRLELSEININYYHILKVENYIKEDLENLIYNRITFNLYVILTKYIDNENSSII